MSISDAWLLTVSKNSHVAIGCLEMVHIQAEIPILTVTTNEDNYCQSQIVWQGRTLAVLDIGLFLFDEPSHDKMAQYSQDIYLCIVAYINEQKNMQEYGAILSSELPMRIKVDDKQVCDLPDLPAQWPMIAVSCFNHELYGVVPILDLSCIFSRKSEIDCPQL